MKKTADKRFIKVKRNERYKVYRNDAKIQMLGMKICLPNTI